MAHARIDGIIARDAPVAVIFRRGPSKQVQMLKWDMETDEITPGQWIKSRVFTRRCDLSPNGKYVVAALTNYSSQQAKRAQEEHGIENYLSSGWTAVSRLPYFSAIGLWFLDSAWSGGGAWKSDTVLGINNTPHSFNIAKKLPKTIKVKKLNLGTGEDDPIWTHLLAKRGWIMESEFKIKKSEFKAKEMPRMPGLCFFEEVKRLGIRDALKLDYLIGSTIEALVPRYVQEQAGLRTKPFNNGTLKYEQRLMDGKDWYSNFRERWELVDCSGQTRLRLQPKSHHPQWLDIDHRGRPVFGDKGCLWAWEGFPDGEPTMIADLNDNKFEQVAPPEWALKW